MKKKVKIMIGLMVIIFVIIITISVLTPKKFMHKYSELTNVMLYIINSEGRYEGYEIPQENWEMIYKYIKKTDIKKCKRFPDHATSYQRDPYAYFLFKFGTETENISFGPDNTCVFYIDDRLLCGEEAYMICYDKKYSEKLREYIDDMKETGEKVNIDNS